MGQALPQVNYDQLEAERLASAQKDLQKELESRSTTGGAHNTLRHVVLRQVTDGLYDKATNELSAYLEYRKNYPSFVYRCKRYEDHCNDLILAIKAKRGFQGQVALSISKQQELHDRVLEHFDELKNYLKQIEKVEREVKLEDMRSTVWILQTLVQCVIVIFGIAFFLDLGGGMASSFITVVNKLLNDGANWIVQIF